MNFLMKFISICYKWVKDVMKMIKYLIKKIKAEKYLFISTILLTLFSCFLNILISLLTSRIINFVMQKLIEEFYKILFVVFIVNILIVIVNSLLSFLKNKLQIYCCFNLNYELFDHLQKCSKDKWGVKDSVYFTQRINSDVNTMFSIFIESGPLLIWNLTLALVSVIYFLFNIPTIIIVICIMILINLLVYSSFRDKILECSKSVKEEQSIYFSKMNLQLVKTNFISIFNCKVKLYKKLREGVDNLYNSFKRFLFKDIQYTMLQSSLKFTCHLALNIIVGTYVLRGELTIDSFILANIFLSYVLNGINYLVDFSSIYIDTYACYERIMGVLDIKEDINGTKDLEAINSIEVRNLSFAYGNNVVFDNLSISFKKNKIYVIKGTNGKGKSTLLNLIMGFNGEEYKGIIFYNNENLKHLNKSSLYKNISFLPQTPYIFDGTVLENINLDGERDADNLEALFKSFGKDDMNRKDFLNESISYEKASFSGGELQKIMLIRALSKKSDVLIMDEPTNELDNLTKVQLLRKVTSLRNNKIVIIVTHDHIFDEIADTIVNL